MTIFVKPERTPYQMPKLTLPKLRLRAHSALFSISKIGAGVDRSVCMSLCGRKLEETTAYLDFQLVRTSRTSDLRRSVAATTTSYIVD